MRPPGLGARHRAWVLPAALAAVGLLGAACSDDAADEVDAQRPPVATVDESAQGTAATASTEEPPGSEPAAVEPYIEALLDSYDEISSQIVANADIRLDPDHELYQRLADLMAPGAAPQTITIDGLSETYPARSYQMPYVDGQLPVERQLHGSIRTVSENEVRFPICLQLDYRIYDDLDRQTEISDGFEAPGDGTAQRVGGAWRITGLTRAYDDNSCGERLE